MRLGGAAVALATAAAIGAATPTRARPSSVAMTCGQTVRLVQASGALVIGTGGQTYDRFVRDRSFCEPTQQARQAFAPSLDGAHCPIGYRCYEPGPRD